MVRFHGFPYYGKVVAPLLFSVEPSYPQIETEVSK